MVQALLGSVRWYGVASVEGGPAAGPSKTSPVMTFFSWKAQAYHSVHQYYELYLDNVNYPKSREPLPLCTYRMHEGRREARSQALRTRPAFNRRCSISLKCLNSSTW
jgi:hypothetical protein